MTLHALILTVVSLLSYGVLGGNLAPWASAADNESGRAQARLVLPATRKLSLQDVWVRSSKSQPLNDIGRGKGIVFSPDLSEPGNPEFYRALGFAYFEGPDWHSILDQIKEYNQSHRESRIEVLLIQSHGTNGDALKLQAGSQPDAARSYISPAALQERLEGTGVRVCLLAACNAGRLFRPENYQTVHAEEGNHLFEPPTLGIINASPDFDPSHSAILIGRRAESHIEDINECHISELSPMARLKLEQSSEATLKASSRIAVPEMLIQLLLGDQRLHLVTFGYEVNRSHEETNDAERERLIGRFLSFVNRIAAQERTDVGQFTKSSRPGI